MDTYHEFRIYFRADYVFTCFARHAGEAIEQLEEKFEGENDSITAINVSTPNGWQNVPMPKFHVISK